MNINEKGNLECKDDFYIVSKDEIWTPDLRENFEFISARIGEILLAL